MTRYEGESISLRQELTVSTAIAYNMGQIMKLVCVCQCVYLSVCQHSRGRIS